MQKRQLGNTGEQLSVIGFGGIVLGDVEPDAASRIVARAVDRGINYFDVAPSYGNAQERLGPALEPHRDQVFLACKTTERLADKAKDQLHQALAQLRTDHLDLYQFHGVSSLEDVDKITGPGGALETFLAARDQGLIRYIGFSAHLEEAALRLLDAFPFDSMLLPINGACWTGVLALKSLAKRPLREGEAKRWPKCWYVPVDTLPEAREALAFTLGQPVTAALCPGHEELLWLACDALETLGQTKVDPEARTLAEGEPIFATAPAS